MQSRAARLTAGSGAGAIDSLPIVAPQDGSRTAIAGDVEQAIASSLELEDKPKASASARAAPISSGRCLFLVCGHACCAASLLVVNKWALKRFPYVWTLATVQFLFASSLTFAAGKLGLVEVDALDLKKLMKFFPAAGMFFVTITAGNAVVGVSNVDTFIVMRSVVPIPSAMLEAFVLGEPCPAMKSWLGLAIILLGAIGYCSANQGLIVGSVSWVTLYLVLMPLDGVLIKHLVGASGLSSWGLVLYNNVCAAVPGLVFSLLLERELLLTPGLASSFCTSSVLAPCILSCFAGLAISFFQLNVRKAISSTAFMVLGVSNKFLSVLINQVAKMDANNDIASLGSVLISILGAILFQQTVSGRGMSQAPKKQGDLAAGGPIGCVLVCLALGAAAYITYTGGKAEGHLQSTTTPQVPSMSTGESFIPVQGPGRPASLG